ncbi:hypothetical protein PG984_013539 [Apiospora sp. TS-2023a]
MLGLLARNGDAAVELQPALEFEASLILGHGGFLLGIAGRPGGGADVGDGLLELAVVAAVFGLERVLDGVAGRDPALFEAV